MTLSGAFVTGTGTGVGKTFVARGLARALRADGLRVAAIKPVETGCAPRAQDALALARAGGCADLADAPGLYRATLPAAPLAASLAGEPPPPPDLAAVVRRLISGHDVALVEGAGGLLVPLDETRTIADLASELALPLLLVARDELGVLSHVLTAAESAAARRLELLAIVLGRADAGADPTRATNASILAARLPDTPVLCFEACDDDDDALASAARRCGLVALLSRTPTGR